MEILGSRASYWRLRSEEKRRRRIRKRKEDRKWAVDRPTNNKKLASICPLQLRIAVPTARCSIGHRQCGASGWTARTEVANSLAAVDAKKTTAFYSITAATPSKKSEEKNSQWRKGGRAAGSRRGERRRRPVWRFWEENERRGGGRGEGKREKKHSLRIQPTLSSWRFLNKNRKPNVSAFSWTKILPRGERRRGGPRRGASQGSRRRRRRSFFFKVKERKKKRRRQKVKETFSLWLVSRPRR